MQCYKNLDIKSAYMDRIREVVNGECAVPEIRYGGERDFKIHASDLDKGLCPIAPGYARIIKPLPQLSEKAVMRFVRGYAVERMLARNGHHVEKDGIHMNVDDMHPEFGIVEIKSTAQSSGVFDPEKECPYWVSRGMTYCIGCGQTKMNIVIYFVVGTMNDFTTWGIGEKHPDTAYKAVDLEAWTLEFTEEELHEHWTYVLRRAEILKQIFESQNIFFMPTESIETHLPFRIRKRKTGPPKKSYWQCEDCRFMDVCFYWNEVINGKTNGL